MSWGEAGHDEIAALIGPEAAERLSRMRGGRALYIPARPGPDSPLVRAVGQIAAELLAARFGGTTLAVPLTAGRHARIRELRRHGWTIARIAAEMCCTERTVYNVLAAQPPDSRQLGLFAARD